MVTCPVSGRVGEGGPPPVQIPRSRDYTQAKTFFFPAYVLDIPLFMLVCVCVSADPVEHLLALSLFAVLFRLGD